MHSFLKCAHVIVKLQENMIRWRELKHAHPGMLTASVLLFFFKCRRVVNEIRRTMIKREEQAIQNQVHRKRCC